MRHVLLLILAIAIGPAASAQQAVVFSDDFEDGDTVGWTTDCLGASGDCTWDASTGILTGHTINGSISINYVSDALEMCDYTYEVDVRAETGADKIIVGRYIDGRHHYDLNIRSSDNTLWLQRKNGVPDETLATAPAPNVRGDWYRLKMVLTGPRIRCFVDGVLKIDVIDPNPVLCGAPGVWCHPNQTTSFDNVDVLAEGAVPVATASWGTVKSMYHSWK